MTASLLAEPGGAPAFQGPVPRLVDAPEPLVLAGDAEAKEPICLFTLHDGDVVPRGVLGPHTAAIVERPEVRTAYLRYRDWGANITARALAETLGLTNHASVALARPLLDAGRFPGVSLPGAPAAARRALSAPVADLITDDAKHRLIVEYYDVITRDLARWLAHAKITVDVRTFTPDTLTRQTPSSIHVVTRRLRYPVYEQPAGAVFDPLFPAVLFGPNCNRSLMLQAVVDRPADARAARLDHAYFMPEGSVEVRVQVWAFFRFLRQRFTEAFPHTQNDVAFQTTWAMLLDITRRSQDAELLRGYLHSYREAPDAQRSLFAKARHAYADIRRFLDLHEDTLVHGYRFSTERPSCITVEVPKGLFYDIDLAAGTVRPREDAMTNARTVAQHVAPLVREHLHAFFPEMAVSGPHAAADPSAIAATPNGSGGQLRDVAPRQG